MKVYLYKILQLTLIFSMIFSTTISATSINPLPDNIERPNYELALYSQEISDGAWSYVNEFFDFFLYSAVLVGSMTVGNETSLGTPFTIQNTDVPIYYFPIISDGVIIGTFRVFVDEIQTSENNRVTYTGVLSPYLAAELNSLLGIYSDVVLLYYDSGNLMTQLDDSIEILSPSPRGYLPELVAYEIHANDFHIVSPLEASITIEPHALDITIEPFATTIHGWRNLPIIETQGDTQWCGAYVTAAILRYLLNNRYSPRARDLMQEAFGTFNANNRYGMGSTVAAARRRGFNPTSANRRTLSWQNVRREIDAWRPIYIVTNNNYIGPHAMAIQGYNLRFPSAGATNPNAIAYFVWNPWLSFFETMDGFSHQVTSEGWVFTWQDTIYGW